jgi:hypothetical protein
MQSDNKHGCHRKILFLLGWILITQTKSDTRWTMQSQPSKSLVIIQLLELFYCMMLSQVLLLLSSVYTLLPNDNVCSSWPIFSKFNTMKPGTGLRLGFIYVICEKIQILLNIKHQLVLSDSSITVIVASNAYQLL